MSESADIKAAIETINFWLSDLAEESCWLQAWGYSEPGSDDPTGDCVVSQKQWDARVHLAAAVRAIRGAADLVRQSRAHIANGFPPDSGQLSDKPQTCQHSEIDLARDIRAAHYAAGCMPGFE